MVKEQVKRLQMLTLTQVTSTFFECAISGRAEVNDLCLAELAVLDKEKRKKRKKGKRNAGVQKTAISAPIELRLGAI